MPNRPPKVCAHPGCPILTAGRYCDKHERAAKLRKDAGRESSTQRGYGRRWSAYRKQYLSEHPLCIKCACRGLTVATDTVDHIIPHRGNYTLFWDPENHQPMCTPCHNTKTSMMDGGFGHDRKGQ